MAKEINKIKLAFFLGKVAQSLADLSTEMFEFSQLLTNEDDKKKVIKFIEMIDEAETDIDAEELIDFCEK